MLDLSSRRPLASRNTKWAGQASRALAARGITPNQISTASMGFALVGALFFWASAEAGPWLRALALLLAALCCQMRLICNLLDGMVAVEAGRGAKDGPFWNEAPDRVSDLLLLGGAGLAAGQPALGLLAGALAIFTAYLRELGRAEGMAPDFSGPFAKPQRMAVLTLAAVFAAFELIVLAAPAVLVWALWLLVLGTGLTVLRRSWRLIAWLKAR